jgi:hypothetical protein
MDMGFALTRRLIFSLVLISAGIVSAQNASVLPPTGGGTSSSMTGSATSSGSSGSSAVNSSVSGAAPSAASSASVSNVTVNSVSSAVVANGLVAGQSGGRSAGSGGNFGQISGDWGHSTSISKAGVKQGASGGHAAGISGAPSAKQLRQAGVSVSASQRALAKSSTTGNRPESLPSSAKSFRGNGTAQSNGGGGASSGGGGGSSGGGQSVADFPDSTKNSATVNPPDSTNANLFAFQPAVASGFPDLSDYQFLQPTLHVRGSGSSGAQQKEDLYRRIERRLTDYKEADAPKTGLKPKKHSHLGSSNPFAPRTTTRTTTSAEEKLNKRTNPGTSF